MGRRCVICTSPERERIDRQLTLGSPVRRVAELFHLNSSSVQRHKIRHLSTRLGKALARREAADIQGADALVAELAASKDKVVAAIKTLEELTNGAKLAALPALLSCVRTHTAVASVLITAAQTSEAVRNVTDAEPAIVELPLELGLERWTQAAARSTPALPAPAPRLADSAEWLATVARIVAALEPFPEAREAVSSALRSPPTEEPELEPDADEPDA